jgi:hypothetical protein
MRAPVTNAADREPRRTRALTSEDVPRRGELAAALGLAGVLAHLLAAQLTLLLAVAMQLAGRLTRWRPAWLTVPAAAGLLWLLAIGPRAALAGFTDGPRQVLGYLAGAAAHPGRLAHLGPAFTGIGRWLPRQAPVALLAASAETAIACWARSLGPVRGGLPAPRPGLLAVARRQYTVRGVKAGGVAGRTGGVLGADWRTGRPVEVPWRAAEGGVLVGGADPGVVSAASFQLVHAAIRRRKPVLVVDLAGTAGLAGALAAVCADTAAPLHVFGASGPGCYDPLRGGHPARNAALVMGMIDWTASTDHTRQTCSGYLNDLFAVAAAAPGDPRIPVLDEVVELLTPAALRDRMSQVPPYHPRRGPLSRRVQAAATRLEADPAPAAFLAGQLAGLRASPLGQWLRPAAGAAGAGVSLGGVLRDRAVALFSLGPRHGRPAQMIANLVALDLTATCAASGRLGLPGDGLAWFGHGDLLARPVLAGLAAIGPQAGLATVVSARPGAAAGHVADLVNVRVQVAGDGPPGAFSLRVGEPGWQVEAGRFVLGALR